MEAKTVAVATEPDETDARESRESHRDSGVIKRGGGSDMVRLTNLAGPQTSDIMSTHDLARYHVDA